MLKDVEQELKNYLTKKQVETEYLFRNTPRNEPKSWYYQGKLDLLDLIKVDFNL